MEPTASDPAVSQQYGMVVGIQNAGQVNALSTINLRGERSVTCKGDFDRATGPLPPGAPAACEAFRKQPDALERAAQLDAHYGRNPDLKKLPMYCVVMSFKDIYDTTDMRTTGGADVRYAMDAPSTDSTIVGELRTKGAIIYAKANLAEYNGGSGNPGGAAKPVSRDFGAGSGVRGPARPAIPTAPNAKPAALVPGRPPRSAPTSRHARSARRPAARAASRRGATESWPWSRPRA
jgi:hypothetical protein